VTLARNGAKNRTRGRNLRSTGTKARARNSRDRNARLERLEFGKQFEARISEAAEAHERVSEAPEQQTATSDVLQRLRPRTSPLTLVEKVARDFIALGKIPEQEGTPDLFEVHIKSFIHDLLESWTHAIVVNKKNGSLPSDIIDLLNKTKGLAVALHQHIDRLSLNLQDLSLNSRTTAIAFAAESIRMIVIKEIDEVRRLLGLPIDVPDPLLKRAPLVSHNSFRRRRGRPRVYMSLAFLVHELECFALGFGGKGFGIPSTRPKKGRIIEMIDRLRKHLVDDADLAELADFLPAPGAHPISVYQLAIEEGRITYAKVKADPNTEFF
jgi:hypothetical protein